MGPLTSHDPPTLSGITPPVGCPVRDGCDPIRGEEIQFAGTAGTTVPHRGLGVINLPTGTRGCVMGWGACRPPPLPRAKDKERAEGAQPLSRAVSVTRGQTQAAYFG